MGRWLLTGSVIGLSACGDAPNDGGRLSGGESSGGSDGGDTGGDDPSPACDPDAPGPRLVRRLSHREYARTLQDLVGADPADIESRLAPDNVVEGYANNAGALAVSFLLADQYRSLAEEVGGLVAGDLAAHAPCTPAEPLDAVCAESFVEAFGERAFRRPLDAADVDRYMDLWSEVALEDDDFGSGIQWVVAAMLASPKFLYRTELGTPADDGSFHLDDWEIASEISYLVTGGPPDEALREAARAGVLTDPDEIEAHVLRLSATTDAHGTLHHFAHAWLGTDQLDLVPRPNEDLTPEIRNAMRGELERLWTAAIDGGWTLSELLTTPSSRVTPELAAFYGIAGTPADPDGAGYGTVEDTKLVGLLTQGALLTTHALPSGSSPIHRGQLIRERLLCQPLPPPPPALDVSPPEVDPDLSTRERYEQHASDPACAGCHQLVDPIGFGFEHYDGLGRWRDRDGDHGIDARGELLRAGDAEGTFDGVAQLGALLAGSSDVRACYASQWATFSLGLAMDTDEAACVEQVLVDAFEASDGRLDALAPALARSPYLRIRAGESLDPPTDPPEDPGTGGGTSTSGGETGSTGDPPDDTDDPDLDPRLETEIVTQSTWDGGQCDDVILTNVSTEDVTWSITLDLPGELSTAWNSQYTPTMGSRITFTGADHNATLAAGSSTTFGYCANY